MQAWFFRQKNKRAVEGALSNISFLCFAMGISASRRTRRIRRWFLCFARVVFGLTQISRISQIVIYASRWGFLDKRT